MPSNHKLITQWPSLVQLRPVERPTVAPDFFRSPAWKRSLIAILYCLLCLEHWIAPQGWIREWIRLNTLVAVTVGTAVLLTGPVVTALLHNLYDWSDVGIQILVKVMSMLAVMPPLLLTFIAIVVLWNLFRRRQSLKHRNQPSHPGYYE
jgi:hypothetical protein